MNSNNRGVAYMLDTSRNKMLACDPNTSSTRFWADLRDCRNNAVIYYMKAVSDLLKKEIADVTADKTIQAQDKKQMLEELNEALKSVQPIQFPGNIELVKKYYDKIDAGLN